MRMGHSIVCSLHIISSLYSFLITGRRFFLAAKREEITLRLQMQTSPYSHTESMPEVNTPSKPPSSPPDFCTLFS